MPLAYVDNLPAIESKQYDAVIAANGNQDTMPVDDIVMADVSEYPAPSKRPELPAGLPETRTPPFGKPVPEAKVIELRSIGRGGGDHK